jgi:hypothetical protein
MASSEEVAGPRVATIFVLRNVSPLSPASPSG